MTLDIDTAKRKNVTLDCDVGQIFWGKNISQYSLNVHNCGKIPLQLDIDLTYNDYLDVTVPGLVEWAKEYWDWASDPVGNPMSTERWIAWNAQGLSIARSIRQVFPKKWRLFYIERIPGQRIRKYYIGYHGVVAVPFFDLSCWIRGKLRKARNACRNYAKSPRQQKHPVAADNGQMMTVHCTQADGWQFSVFTMIEDDERKSWATIFDYKTETTARFLTTSDTPPERTDDIAFFMWSPRKLEPSTEEHLLQWFHEKPVRGMAQGCTTNWEAIKQSWKDMREVKELQNQTEKPV